MKDLERTIMTRVRASRAGVESYLAAGFYRTDAEWLVLEANGRAASQTGLDTASTRMATAMLVYTRQWGTLDMVREGGIVFSSAFSWSRCWVDAEMALCRRKTDRIAALKGELNRVKELEKFIKSLRDGDEFWTKVSYEGSFYRADAELRVLRAEGGENAERGRSKLIKMRLDAAKAAYEAEWKGFLDGVGFVEDVYEFSAAWRMAAMATATAKVEKIAITKGHLTRMRQLEKTVNEWFGAGKVGVRDQLAAEYYRAEAEMLSLEAKED
jgi:hypothetical protein